VRVLALDYGSARCGCAISDPTGTLATPLDVVTAPATRRGLGHLVELVAERGVERIVVGLPLSLSGPAVAVELYDERFTTALARRGEGRRAPEDSRAAAHLLEGWLTRTRATAEGEAG